MLRYELWLSFIPFLVILGADALWGGQKGRFAAILLLAALVWEPSGTMGTGTTIARMYPIF